MVDTHMWFLLLHTACKIMHRQTSIHRLIHHKDQWKLNSTFQNHRSPFLTRLWLGACHSLHATLFFFQNHIPTSIFTGLWPHPFECIDGSTITNTSFLMINRTATWKRSTMTAPLFMQQFSFTCLLSCAASLAMYGQACYSHEITSMPSLFQIYGSAQIYGSDLRPSAPHTGTLVLHCGLYTQQNSCLIHKISAHDLIITPFLWYF